MDTVQKKVYSNGGHFDDEFKAGTIPDDARERMTPEIIEYIEGCIIQRATRQYFSAPTLKFKETVCENYKGPLEQRIVTNIIKRKEAVSPAPKGTMWKFDNYRIIQVKVIIQEPELNTQTTTPVTSNDKIVVDVPTSQRLDSETNDYEIPNELTLAIQQQRKKTKLDNDQTKQAETASKLC
jgi:hypothetical protein